MTDCVVNEERAPQILDPSRDAVRNPDPGIKYSPPTSHIRRAVKAFLRPGSFKTEKAPTAQVLPEKQTKAPNSPDVTRNVSESITRWKYVPTHGID